MSVSVNNEMDQLFSLAFGKDWVQAGLLARTGTELEAVESLASDHAAQALGNIASLGKVIGAVDEKEIDVFALCWSIVGLAEYGSVCQHIAGFAREFQKPDIRAIYQGLSTEA